MLIRKMTEDDLCPLHVLLSDPQVMTYMESPYTREQTERFLLDAGLKEPPRIYAVEESGSFIGYVIYHDYDEDSIEIGWMLYPEYWNKGYASKLTEKLIEKAFLSGKDIVIECDSRQKTSKHIAAKYGFQFEETVENLDVFRLKRRL